MFAHAICSRVAIATWSKLVTDICIWYGYSFIYSSGYEVRVHGEGDGSRRRVTCRAFAVLSKVIYRGGS